MIDELLTIDDAASNLGVSRASFLQAAAEGGYLHRMGRRTFVRRSELWRIIETCRLAPKAQDCTGGKGRTGQASGSSATQAGPSVVAGRTIAERLKRSSRNTSQVVNGDQVRVLLSK